MTTALRTKPGAGTAAAGGLAERRAPRPATHSATRPCAREAASSSEPSTLEDALLGAWEDLRSRGRAECLVCGGSVKGRDSSAPGECRACGATLS